MDQAERLRMLVRERTEDSRPLGCRTIAVTSGKGGVGKTTVAVNLAIELAKLGSRVAIVDADLGLADVDVTLGMLPEAHLGHVIDGHKRLQDVCVAGPYGLKVVSGGSGVEKLANLTDCERSFLMSRIREFVVDLDFLVIDTSPGIGRNVMDFLSTADSVIMVTTSEPTSLTDCYAAVKTIYQNLPQADVSLLVNRAESAMEAAQVAGSIDTVLLRFLGRRLAGWSFLPEDSSVGMAGHKQTALVEAFAFSPAASALRRMAIQTAGDSPRAPMNTHRGSVCTA